MSEAAWQSVPDLVQDDTSYLEVRLAEDESEVRAAQELRYRVFYREMAAHPSLAMAAAERDFDDYDGLADHLMVIDHRPRKQGGGVVGTYRLLRRSVLAGRMPFYSAAEFDLACLNEFDGEVLELGRSCVDRPYRTRPTMQLLWRGLAAYVFAHDVSLMFGCASLPGNDVKALDLPLSYLHHRHLAPEFLRPHAIAARHVAMDRVSTDGIDDRQILAALPPLLKGYLRAGGSVGDGAVIDHQFNTVDVCMVVETERVSPRYYRHYSREVGAGGAPE